MDGNHTVPWMSTLQYPKWVPYSILDVYPTVPGMGTLQYDEWVPYSTMVGYPTVPWLGTIHHRRWVRCSTLNGYRTVPWIGTLQYPGCVPYSTMMGTLQYPGWGRYARYTQGYPQSSDGDRGIGWEIGPHHSGDPAALHVEGVKSEPIEMEERDGNGWRRRGGGFYSAHNWDAKWDN